MEIISILLTVIMLFWSIVSIITYILIKHVIGERFNEISTIGLLTTCFLGIFIIPNLLYKIAKKNKNGKI